MDKKNTSLDKYLKKIKRLKQKAKVEKNPNEFN